GDAHGMDVGRRAGDAHMRGHRAALLRQAGLVEHAGALVLQVRGHAQQGADGHYAGAADAGDQDVPGLLEVGADLRLRQPGQALGRVHALALAQAAALDGDEAGAEALHAAEVLVAVALVDLALAAVLGFLGQHADAVGLHAAVAAALADQRVDGDALG